MKTILTVTLLLLCSTSFTQTETEAIEALKPITNQNQVDSLRKAHPAWDIYISKTLPVGMSYDSLLYKTEVGEILATQYSVKAPKFERKVIAKGKEEVCKVEYIYLNGTKHSSKEIDKLRKKIIARYEKGTPFIDLAKEYNEDGNQTGQLDWFYKGMMVEDFDKVARAAKAGEIFTVDVPSKSWYYVVLKSEGNKLLDCTYSVGIKLGK